MPRLYRTTIARNPACWLAYDHLIDTLYQENRIAEAMNLFEEELRINPAEAHYNLGFVLFRKGRASEAIDQYEQAFRINPDYAEVHNNLASALSLTGRFSEAIDQSNEVLRIDPNFSKAHTNPTHTRINAVEFSREARSLLGDFDRRETGDFLVLTSKGQQEALFSLERASEGVTAPVLRLERALHNFSAFLVMPLFAFANAGVKIDLQCSI